MFDAVLMGWSNATHGTIHLQTDRRRVIWSGFNLYSKRSESASIYYDNHPKHGWHTTNRVNIQGLVDNHKKHVDQFCFVILCTYGNKNEGPWKPHILILWYLKPPPVAPTRLLCVPWCQPEIWRRGLESMILRETNSWMWKASCICCQHLTNSGG